MDTYRPQFSLAFLFLLMTAAGVMCAFAPMAYRFAASIEWNSPTFGVCIGWGGLVAVVLGILYYLFRR